MPRLGFRFEIELNKLVSYLNDNGYHAHKNHPQRLNDGTRVAGEPFDYEVIANGKTFCFDAKECAAERWSLANAKFNQVAALKACAHNGAEAFFLVHFTKKGVIKKFPIDLVASALKQGRKSLSVTEGSDFNWQKMFLTK